MRTHTAGSTVQSRLINGGHCSWRNAFDRQVTAYFVQMRFWLMNVGFAWNNGRCEPTRTHRRTRILEQVATSNDEPPATTHLSAEAEHDGTAFCVREPFLPTARWLVWGDARDRVRYIGVIFGTLDHANVCMCVCFFCCCCCLTAVWLYKQWSCFLYHSFCFPINTHVTLIFAIWFCV